VGEEDVHERRRRTEATRLGPDPLGRALGVLFPPGEWYAGLDKPPFNPPNWIFGPVWTALYLGMGVAAWRVWRRVGWRAPTFLFLAQLALNALWSPVFFGAHLLGLAALVLASLVALVALTLRAFWRVDKVAGALFVPYLAWVSFALLLNLALWRLNAG